MAHITDNQIGFLFLYEFWRLKHFGIASTTIWGYVVAINCKSNLVPTQWDPAKAKMILFWCKVSSSNYKKYLKWKKGSPFVISCVKWIKSCSKYTCKLDSPAALKVSFTALRNAVGMRQRGYSWFLEEKTGSLISTFNILSKYESRVLNHIIGLRSNLACTVATRFWKSSTLIWKQVG